MIWNRDWKKNKVTKQIDFKIIKQDKHIKGNYEDLAEQYYLYWMDNKMADEISDGWMEHYMHMRKKVTQYKC